MALPAPQADEPVVETPVVEAAAEPVVPSEVPSLTVADELPAEDGDPDQVVFLRFMGDKPTRIGRLMWGPKSLNQVNLAEARDLMAKGQFEIVRSTRNQGG